MNFLALLGNRWVQYGCLIIAAIAAYAAWSIHEQNLGAYKEQAKQQAAQLRQERAQSKAISDRLQAEKSALARSSAELRAYQEAKQNDKATIDWRTTCGSLPLPVSVRNYVAGVPRPQSPHPTDTPPATPKDGG